MPGTKIGARKAALTNMKRYGGSFYQQIGRKGGRNGHSGGFAAHPELAKEAGTKGGIISRRGSKSFSSLVLNPNADEIRELYADGMTIPQLAKYMKVPEWTMRKWANENIPGYSRAWGEK